MSPRVGRGPVGISPSAPKMPSTISAAITIVTNISAVIRTVYVRAVVLAVDGEDRQHDQVGEQERDHAGERDPAGPQHGGEGDVADRADEAEHGDERADDHVLDRRERRRGVREEQVLEEAVAELGDEPGEQEPDRDLLPEHLPVAAEVVGDVRPRAARGEALAPGQLLARRVVLMAGVGLARVLAGVLLELRG